MRFLLVDRIESYEADKRIVGAKVAAMSEDYFEWHFPGRPIMPGMLILEACAQLAGWLEAASSDFENWFLLDRVHSARYMAFAVPGDRIELTLERVDNDDPARRSYRGESKVGTERGAVFEIEGRIVPLESLEAREKARRTFAGLTGSA